MPQFMNYYSRVWELNSLKTSPTDESWNHFHSFLNAKTINLCGLHANMFLCHLMLTICSNVWRVNTVLPFLTTFLAISQKKSKIVEKKTRKLLLSSVLVNFCRRQKNVDIASTKHAFFVLWGREVLRETSRFLFIFRCWRVTKRLTRHARSRATCIMHATRHWHSLRATINTTVILVMTSLWQQCFMEWLMLMWRSNGISEIGIYCRFLWFSITRAWRKHAYWLRLVSLLNE